MVGANPANVDSNGTFWRANFNISSFRDLLNVRNIESTGSITGATRIATSAGFYGPIVGSNAISGSTVISSDYVMGDVFIGFNSYTSSTTVNISSGSVYQSYLLVASSTITVNLNNLGGTYDGVVIHIRSRGQRFNLAPASGVTYYDISNGVYTFPSSEGFPNSRNATILFSSSVGPSWYLISYQ